MSYFFLFRNFFCLNLSNYVWLEFNLPRSRRRVYLYGRSPGIDWTRGHSWWRAARPVYGQATSGDSTSQSQIRLIVTKTANLVFFLLSSQYNTVVVVVSLLFSIMLVDHSIFGWHFTSSRFYCQSMLSHI